MFGLIASRATTSLTVGSWSPSPQQPEPQGVANLLHSSKLASVDNSKPPNLVHTAHVRAAPNADPVLTLQVGHTKGGGTMLNPLAIGVTVGGLLLDVVAPRPKPRAGLAFEEPSLLSTARRLEDTQQASAGEYEGRPIAGRPVRWGPRASG